MEVMDDSSHGRFQEKDAEGVYNSICLMGTNEGNAICILGVANRGELAYNLVAAMPRKNFLNPRKRDDKS